MKNHRFRVRKRWFSVCSVVRAHPLKVNETGALENQFTKVTLYQLAVFLSGDVKLHPVAALHLKHHVKAGVMMLATGMMGVFIHHNGLYVQHRGFVVVVPLAEHLDEYEDEHADDQHRNDGKHNRKGVEGEHRDLPFCGNRDRSGSQRIIHGR